MSNLFNKVINNRQFNFQPVEFKGEVEYHVDVKDEEGKRWEFRMFRSDDNWKMESEKLPPWIPALENELAMAINEHD